MKLLKIPYPLFIKPSVFFLILAAISLVSCDSYTRLTEKRIKRAENATGDILIGVVDSSPPSLFMEGINLAVEEINQNGIFGRKIKTIPYNDMASPHEGEKIARKLAKNPDVVAVIGHMWSTVAIPASVIYEKYGILFISPGATHPNLTLYNNNLTFRNIPITDETALRMAQFVEQNIASFKLTEQRLRRLKEKGIPEAIFIKLENLKDYEYKTEEQFIDDLKRTIGEKETDLYRELILPDAHTKIIIFYQRYDVARRLAEAFHKEADTLGIKIASTRSYFEWQDDFRSVLSILKKNYDFDMIFLSGALPVSALLIKQAYELDIRVPFLTGYGLDSPELWSIAGQAANGTIVATLFDPNLPQKITRGFVKRFISKYGVEPDTWAAQGYDAMMVLAYAIEKSGSTIPSVVAMTLKFLEDWQSITGTYSFTFRGDIQGRPVFFKKLLSGRFLFLEDKREKKFDPFYVSEEVTLRLPVEGIIPTIDPGLTQDMTSIEITEQLFLGLTDFAPKTYEPVPELATSWSVSEDGTVYRFQMRDNAKWTDGTPVTAHDLVWAIQRNIRPETRCPNASMLYIIRNARAINGGELKNISKLGVRAIDDFTAEFTLEHPASYFPGMAGLWVYRPLPRKTIEKYGDQWTKPKNIQTNGSYYLVEWIKGMVMALRKNPDYFDAKNVLIPEVHYHVIPANSVGLALYKNNELDIMGSSYLRLPLMEVPSVKALFKEEYSKEPQFCTYAYGFNTNKYPVNDPLVRRAISSAIDRRSLIALITQGDEEPAKTFTRPSIFGAVNPKDDPDIGIMFNPVQAKKWLSDAGYKVEKNDNGKDFPPITLMFNSSELHAKIAQAVQSCLKYYLNIDVILQEKKWEDYVEAMETEPPHIFRFGWCADYPDANNFLNEQLHPFKSANYIGWENFRFAELMDDAEKEPDPEKRKALYKNAEHILNYEEAAVIPIYFETAHCLVKPRIKGWYHMALGGQHIRNWSFSNK